MDGENFDLVSGEVWEDAANVAGDGGADGFSETQVAELRAPLDRRRVKSRSQANRTFSYIEGWWAIREANRIFGFDGWERQTVAMDVVAEREVSIGRDDSRRPGWAVAYLCRCRIRVRAGNTWVVRDGTGYGSGIDAALGQAHESAAKEAETDAMKRAMMTFGNAFGLALYDKDQAEVSAPEKAAPRQAAPAPAQSRRAPPPRQQAQEHTPAQRGVIEQWTKLRDQIVGGTDPVAVRGLIGSVEWRAWKTDSDDAFGEHDTRQVEADLKERAEKRADELTDRLSGARYATTG